MDGATLQHLPPASLVLDPENVRADDSPGPELVGSVAEKGVVQPILGESVGGVVHVIAGHRRTRAALEARRPTVPVLVYPGPMDVADRLSLQIVENLHRVDLNPIEKALALQRLWRETGRPAHRELAIKAGLSQPTVSRYLRLLDLPQRVQDRVAAGEVSVGSALGEASGHRAAGDAGIRASAVRDPNFAEMMAALRRFGRALAAGNRELAGTWAQRVHDRLVAYMPGGCGPAPTAADLDPEPEAGGPTTACPYCPDRLLLPLPLTALSRTRAIIRHLDASPMCASKHAARTRTGRAG